MKIMFICLPFFFGNALCSVVMSEMSQPVPCPLFFQIVEWAAQIPNLLVSTHPKEIQYQDDALKKFRLVCWAWRNALDSRVDFEHMARLFIFTRGFSYEKCFRTLKFRWDQLEQSYCNKNVWLIEQRNKINTIKEQSVCESAKNPQLEKIGQSFSPYFNQYRKTMKAKLKTYEYDGLLMLENCMANGIFVKTYSLTRAIHSFLKWLDYNDGKRIQEFLLFKKILSTYDLTDLFSLLFERVVFFGDDYSFGLLTEAKIDYYHFLCRIHWSFCNRVKVYKWRLSDWYSRVAVSKFFQTYDQCFTAKDQNEKSFLYYLLLHSKNNFLNIQIKLLIAFIKGIAKKLSDYPEDEQDIYRQLFAKNFLPRFKNNFSYGEQYLKTYFNQ